MPLRHNGYLKSVEHAPPRGVANATKSTSQCLLIPNDFNNKSKRRIGGKEGGGRGEEGGGRGGGVSSERVNEERSGMVRGGLTIYGPWTATELSM